MVAERVKSPYPTTQDPRYGELVREELRRLLADPDAPARALLDVTALGAAVRSVPPDRLRFVAERSLALDTWLRDYDVTIDV